MAAKRLASNIGDMLLREGLITETHLETAHRVQRDTSHPLGRILVEMGLISENVKMDFLRRKTGYPTVVLSEEAINDHVLALIPRAFAIKNNLVPVRLESTGVVVAMEDPTDLVVIDQLADIVAMPILPAIASAVEIEGVLERYGVDEGDEDVSLRLPLHLRAPLWYRACRYLFLPLTALGPFVLAVASLMLWPDSFFAEWLAEWFTSPDDQTAFNFDVFLFTFLGWGIWCVVMFEVNGLLFDRDDSSPGEEPE
ncbi:hypothetical protein ACFL34_00020 [Candidatus Sumerlaeota bacterium]